MVKLRQPLSLCKLSDLTTMHPNCLRLTMAVTRQCPRLANDVLLNLAMWEFHPLNRSPFQGAPNPLPTPALHLYQNISAQMDTIPTQEWMLSQWLHI